MIISKDSNNNWIPTAGGTGTFIGTKAAFDAVKATLPDNTVAYITDDGNGDLVTEDEAQALITARFRNVVIPNNTFTVNANNYYDLVTNIDFTNDMVVIPRWMGGTRLFMGNAFNSNGKLALTISNPTATAMTQTNVNVAFTIIYTGTNFGE